MVTTLQKKDNIYTTQDTQSYKNMTKTGDGFYLWRTHSAHSSQMVDFQDQLCNQKPLLSVKWKEMLFCRQIRR